MTITEAAAILYTAFHSQGYGRAWASAPAKRQWLNAAEALLSAVEREHEYQRLSS